MYISPKASRLRQREAQLARDNRAEIRKALAKGEISKRDLIRWGIFTAAGALALKNGLSPFARERLCRRADRHAAQPAVRRRQVHPEDAAAQTADAGPARPQCRQRGRVPGRARLSQCQAAVLPQRLQRLCRSRDHQPVPAADNPFRNPVTNRGPMEGRPPGEFFAHQRWEEFFPKVGYVDVVDASARPAPSSTPISPTRPRTRCGATAPATRTPASCRRS